MRWLVLCIAMAVCGTAAAQSAEQIDFGDDSGNYANDGECDDPRFTGPGMTTTALLDEDIRADATDCRTAYEAGELTLKSEGAASDVETLPVDPWDFGNDDGEYANDGECDDRRFRGPGMTDALDWADLGRDASDCRAAFESGQISRWIYAEALEATQCSAIDFGDDSGDYALDDECDDPRFEGLLMSGVLIPEDRLADASDCRRACAFGLIALRDYGAAPPEAASDGAAPGKATGNKRRQPAIISD